jgi:hypothetical protein
MVSKMNFKFRLADDPSDRQAMIMWHVLVIGAESRRHSPIIDVGLEFWMRTLIKFRGRELVRKALVRIFQLSFGVDISVLR